MASPAVILVNAFCWQLVWKWTFWLLWFDQLDPKGAQQEFARALALALKLSRIPD